MPIATTYPGVYIVEKESGVRTITGVATSITAFLGRALRGPTDTPVTINSFSDFERTFGGLWAGNSLGYAVRDFYRNGGSQAIIVRLYSPTFADSTDQQKAAAAAKATADAAVAPDPAAAAKAAKATADAAVGANAAAAAAAAKTKADTYTADPQMTAAKAVFDAADAASKVAGATPADVAKAAKAVADKALAAASGAAAAAAKTKADTYTADPEMSAAKAVFDAADAASKVAGATPEDVKAQAQGALATAAPLDKASLTIGELTLQAASAGAWGNSLRARVDQNVTGADAANLFNLYVRDGATGAVEVFRNVSVLAAHIRRVDKVLANGSSLVRVNGNLPASRPPASADPDASKKETDEWADNSAVTNAKVTDPASNGAILQEGDFTGVGKADKKHGLYALDDADLFNILCIPPYLDSGDPGTSGDVNSGLVTDAAAYCLQRRAILLVDPRSTWITKDTAKGGVSAVGTDSDTAKNAALYFPRLRQPDPMRDNQVGEFAPCGAIAGLYARTDSSRGVWKAPAGLAAGLVGVPELSVPINDAENGELNPLGMNCLRTMPAAGRVVWGARTLAGDDRMTSEWKYVPVRRTALFIEESLYRGTQWVVFEPNDEPLWSQIRLNIGAFMHNLFRQGAFQGTTPQAAYFVKCDKETTTQADIDLGIVNIVVGFAPLKPAEFVIITLQQLAGEIQT